MNYVGQKSTICVGDLKQAALYFDRVLPLSIQKIKGAYVDGADDLVFWFPEPMVGEDLIYLIFGENVDDKPILKWGYLGRYIRAWKKFLKAMPTFGIDDESYKKISELYLQDTKLLNGKSVREEFSLIAKDFGFSKSSILLTDESRIEGPYEHPILALPAIKLVDTSNISWQQIWGLRDDPVARKKLRNLRLFFYENYNGKSKSYITDDLEKRLEDYEDIAKQYDFELKTSMLSGLLDSKNIQGLAAAGIAAAFIGGPIAGIATPVIIEIGKLTLEFGIKKYSMQRFEKSHELAYIIQAKEIPHDSSNLIR
ncbi:hypothetical protein [Nitrosomonas sp.]|uniref:hypothetical protein n=1 Tax=Nitrosomonas sp. TaxID=42353 RepID=UPI00207E710B|nr:hypothetical protein [Nitrosomonas sp.]GJL76341.1 MAG: hypothetical protein NMNS02_24470 [Nitrosomonas sp.]